MQLPMGWVGCSPAKDVALFGLASPRRISAHWHAFVVIDGGLTGVESDASASRLAKASAGAGAEALISPASAKVLAGLKNIGRPTAGGGLPLAVTARLSVNLQRVATLHLLAHHHQEGLHHIHRLEAAHHHRHLITPTMGRVDIGAGDDA